MGQKLINPDQFLTSDLRSRGWTPALIRRFLHEPDTIKPNPCYKRSPPIKLYSVARVATIEATQAWRDAAAGASTRKKAAARAVTTKRVALREYIDRLTIEVPDLHPSELDRLACDHYNARQAHRAEQRALRGGWDDFDERRPATLDSDRRFLDRIAVNMLRHAGTDYEWELQRLFGRVGAEEGYVLIKRKVLAAIRTAYPQLAGECERQATTLTAIAPQQVHDPHSE